MPTCWVEGSSTIFKRDPLIATTDVVRQPNRLIVHAAVAIEESLERGQLGSVLGRESNRLSVNDGSNDHCNPAYHRPGDALLMVLHMSVDCDGSVGIEVGDPVSGLAMKSRSAERVPVLLQCLSRQ